MSKGACQLITAAIGTGYRSCLGTSRQDQAVSLKQTLITLHGKHAIFRLPRLFDMTGKHRLNAQMLCFKAQRIQYGSSLIRIRVNVAIPVLRYNADPVKKVQGIPDRKTIQYLHGKQLLAAPVIFRPHGQVCHVAPPVSRGQDFLSHPVHMLQNGHLCALSGCHDGCHKSGSPSSDDQYFFLHVFPPP